jgi:hypothetical protein
VLCVCVCCVSVSCLGDTQGWFRETNPMIITPPTKQVCLGRSLLLAGAPTKTKLVRRHCSQHQQNNTIFVSDQD